MSKLARALTLAAMVAAMNLAGMTALAQAHTTDQASQVHDGQHGHQHHGAGELGHGHGHGFPPSDPAAPVAAFGADARGKGASQS